MTFVYELDGRFFETRTDAEAAATEAYYTYFPVKEHTTEYTWAEWETRFDLARDQGESISDAAHFAFGKLEAV